MQTKRDPTEVIKAILAVLPEGHAGLRAQLAGISYDAGYLAPEVQYVTWNRLMVTLTASLPNPALPGAEPWVVRISDIVQGRADA